MLIRREDNKPVEELTKGSHKKVWFTCDDCGIGILQRYRTYLLQNDGHYCKSCRNRHTANREDVKIKQSKATKKRWQNQEYREKVIKSIKNGIRKSWDENYERKERLSKNNPMFNDETRKKVSEKTATSVKELKKLCEKHGFEYIDRKLRKRGGCRIILKCENGHVTEKRLDSFRSGNYGCLKCGQKISKPEKEISNYIESLGFSVIENDREIISPLELDIIISDKKIAIEYCGLYWHSQSKKSDKNYHLNKLKLCNEKGYRLITIFEDEWIYKQDIVRSRLKHILGVFDRRIYARKCYIREISTKTAREFIEKYHIQGYSGCSVKLGLYYQNEENPLFDELVAVLTMAKPSLSKGRKDNNNRVIYELSRFCSSCCVLGGASKLLTYFKRNYKWAEIYTFADRRWSEGNVYKKIGFINCRETKPNYFYFKKNSLIRQHRFVFRKNILKDKLKKFDSEKTEYENMIDNGYYRIWDCGHYRLEMFNHNKNPIS